MADGVGKERHGWGQVTAHFLARIIFDPCNDSIAGHK
jgi:hypothetical protein